MVAAPLDSTAMAEGYDAIVVGGGTAGSVVAARLVEAGRPGAGARSRPRLRLVRRRLGWPSDLLDAATIPTSHDWGYRSGDELPGRALPYERARVIGGCSAHNGCTVSWGHRARLRRLGRARARRAGRPTTSLPLFREASLRMRVRRFRDDEIAPFHRAFIDAGLDMGLPELDDLESLDGVPSVCAEPSNSPEGVRWNAAFAYLDPVRGRPELEMRGGVPVTDVVVEGGRAWASTWWTAASPSTAWADLSWSPAARTARPSCCCAAASVPPRSCGTSGLDIVADVPGVGRNLHDHPSFELLFEPTDELDARTTAFAATGKPVPDEQAFAKVATSRARRTACSTCTCSPRWRWTGGLAIFAACLTPRSRGALTLRSYDPVDRPEIDHAYLQRRRRARPGGADRRGGAGPRRSRRTRRCRPLLGREVEPGPDVEGAGAARSGAGGGDPLLAPGRDVRDGCGPTIPTAVTDADGRVRGWKGWSWPTPP